MKTGLTHLKLSITVPNGTAQWITYQCKLTYIMQRVANYFAYQLRRAAKLTVEMTVEDTKVDKNAAGQLLDSLYLDMFHLIESHTQSRIDIERTSSSGAILLARTKFQQGGQSLSTAQIPTENSAEFNALCRVVYADDTDNNKIRNITTERHDVDKQNGYVDPLHWFSVLPPMSLRNAVDKFKKLIELIAESTNLQRELNKLLNSINRLRRSEVLNG